MWSLSDIIPQIFVYLPLAYNGTLSIFRYSSSEADNIAEMVNDLAHSILLSYVSGRLIRQESFNIAIVTLGVSYYHALKLYRKHVQGKVNVHENLRDKTYIITGSNTGIGFEVAKSLLKMNARVVLACRSVDRANEAKKALIKATDANEKDVIVIPLDLTDLDSVKKFVKSFNDLKIPLHGLVNNAGLISDKRTLTKDGVELTFASNHLGHFLLTNLLIPDLTKTNGRIVNLSSCLFKLTKTFNFEDLTFADNYEGFKVYSQSKLSNILFTRGLASRLEEKKIPITTYAVHPGCVRTEFTRGLSWWMQLGNQLVAPILSLLQKTPAQGAYGIVEVLINPAIKDKNPNGTYFFHGEKAPLTEAAINEEYTNELWKISEKMTGFTWKTKSQ